MLLTVSPTFKVLVLVDLVADDSMALRRIANGALRLYAKLAQGEDMSRLGFARHTSTISTQEWSFGKAVSRMLVAPAPTSSSEVKLHLARYEALMHVLEVDEELFFATAQANLSHILPMIYTPAVGTVCLHYSSLDIQQRGLRLGINQKGSLSKILSKIREDIEIVVVTDGERILGLGDLGANGHGIPVGKLLLYSACGGIDPAKCLPVTLDVGCNTPKIREDPDYIGIREPRVKGAEYAEFVEEFMQSTKARFGENCLIQFEDFDNKNALPLLNKYKDSHCCFNDDIQGTAAVVLGGLLSSLRIDGVPSSLTEHRFLFYGAGSAGLGIGDLIVRELMCQGEEEAKARGRCFFIDKPGLIYKGRENLSQEQSKYAYEVEESVAENVDNDLASLIRLLRPTALIGVSTQCNAFDADVLEAMSELQHRPLIFALSNPTSKAECTAEAAYRASGGRAIFASGSPFDPVTIGDKTLVPGQGNNSYVFPGIGKGVLMAKANRVTDNMILAASRRLAKLVSDEQLANSNVFPPINDMLQVSTHIARSVAEQAVEDGVGSVVPTLEEIECSLYAPGKNV